jgi:hypothetical protein
MDKKNQLWEGRGLIGDKLYVARREVGLKVVLECFDFL